MKASAAAKTTLAHPVRSFRHSTAPKLRIGLIPPKELACAENKRTKMKREKKPTKGTIFISRQQVEGMLGCSRDTVKRLEQRGLINPIKLNARLIRYRLADVEAMMDAHEVKEGE
jgi:predicted DNA-binding transcriptional regulator AlpA